MNSKNNQNVWVWAVNDINWPVVKEKKVWAVDVTKKSEKVKKGDKIIFYPAKSNYFQGVFEVISDWHPAKTKWPDGRVTVLEVDLKEIETGFASTRKLAKSLEFVRDPKKIGTVLMATDYGSSNFSRPISNQDYVTILSELKLQKSHPPLGDAIISRTNPPQMKIAKLEKAPVRLHLVKALFENLLGPKMGPDEEIENPTYQYVVGVLKTRFERKNEMIPNDPSQEINLKEKKNEREQNQDTIEPEEEKISADQDLNSMKGATSLGLSFAVKGPGKKIAFCTTWGRYEKSAEISSKLWRRQTNFFTAEVELTKKKQIIIPKSGSSKNQRITKEGIEIEIHSIKIMGTDDLYRVSIFLVNNTKYDYFFPSTAEFVFQPQIRINCLGNNLHDLGFLEPEDEKTHEKFIYRNRRNFGTGRLCGVLWKKVDPEDKEQKPNTFSVFTWPDSKSKYISSSLTKDFFKPDIRTEFFPTYSILQPDLSEKSKNNFNADDLSSIWDSDKLGDKLKKIHYSYSDWIKLQKTEFSKMSISDELRDAGKKNIDQCFETATRINEGIIFLQKDEKARAAFCFMNKVMSTKTRWENRRKNVDPFEWWEYQMAFILKCLRGVANDDRNERDVCDILWFPTGGGKTEAYLGLMIFAVAYRRLTKFEGFETDGGVSVISRYTLRLLTIQQFQRAQGAITAADFLRVTGWKPEHMNPKLPDLQERLRQKKLWGEERFSIGLWIGGDGTPNYFKDSVNMKTFTKLLNAEGMLREKKGNFQSKGEPAQILNCPCCGELLGVPSAEKAGLEEKPIHTIFWIFKSRLPIHELQKIKPSNLSAESGEGIKVLDKTLQIYPVNKVGTVNYYCIKLQFENVRPRSNVLNEKRIISWWDTHVKHALAPKDGIPATIASASAARPGYFIVGRGGDNYDFVIHCPNPKCELNDGIEWFENRIKESEPAIGRPFKIDGKPQSSLFMPISAYTIDEQICKRCPTVLISTVDKFAMLPFSSERLDSSSIFGNVDCYHKYKGYGRTKFSAHIRDAIQDELHSIRPFLPPSLIIQDELHLLEGPLGSVVGIYELAVELLSEKANHKPKYIASSATVKESESQVGTLFRKKVSIFPPQGISIEDNYFSESREDPDSKNDDAGRLYLGVSAPNKMLTVPVRIWGTLLSEISKIRNEPEKYDLDVLFQDSEEKEEGITFRKFVEQKTDPYWTLIGYFNAKKELQIARGLYGDDIPRVVKSLSSESYSSINYRTGNAGLTPAIRYVPITIDDKCDLEKISVFCENAKGRISVSLYAELKGKTGPEKIVGEIEEDDRNKNCEKGENVFWLKSPYPVVHHKETLWVGIINDSTETRFQVGTGNSESFSQQFPSNKIKEIIEKNNFPDNPQNINKENVTIRISISSVHRNLSYDPIELTGETESQELPSVLRLLNKEPSNVDAVFTTSVFGTGIDIQRLGLMVVMGQPKTTGTYIQSTGRVGRKAAGLVVTWLKATNVRDLNHYENFTGYHRRLHYFLEPVSASPYSEECMKTNLGPVLVAVLRNGISIDGNTIAKEWIPIRGQNTNEGPMRMYRHKDDQEIKNLISVLQKKVVDVNITNERKPTKAIAEMVIDNIKNKWFNCARNCNQEKKNLIYYEWTIQNPAKENVVLGFPQHKEAKKKIVFENAKISMREVEPQANFGDD